MIRLSQIATIVLLLIAGKAEASAPPILEWQKCYGGTMQDIPGGLIKLNDGNTLLLGNVDSQNGDIVGGHGSTDIWLTKIDSVGNIIWKHTIGGSSIDVGTSVLELPGGKLLVAGYSSSVDGDILNNKGNFDVILLCFDPHGYLIWEKNYGGTMVDLCYSMIHCSDGNLLLGGATYSDDGDVSWNNGSQDLWLLKLDINGNIIWELSSGGSNSEICFAIEQDAQGNFYAAGTTNSIDGDITSFKGNNDLWVVKVSNNGSPIWNKNYGGSEYETGQCLLIDSQQRILIGGYTRSDNIDVTANQGFGDCWFLQINQNGAIVFQKTFGGTGAENLYSMLQTDDGGLMLVSGSTSNDFDVKSSKGYEDVWILKLSAGFTSEWTRTYGGTGNDRPVRLIENNMGGYLLAAYTFSNNNDVSGQHGIADMWIVNFGCKIPSAAFTTTLTGCMGDTLTVQNNSINAAAYEWNVNSLPFSTNANVRIPLSATGNLHIELNAMTCLSISTHSVDVNVTNCGLPSVSIMANITTVCPNTPVSFTNLSPSATSWQWTFPGGTPGSSTLQNPVVSYASPGVYSVMLTASNSYGNQSSMRFNYINVSSPPITPTVTINGSQLMSSYAQSYQWLFNNNPVTGATSRNYTANALGYYSVAITNASGCSAVSQPVYYSVMSVEEKSNEKFNVYPNPTTGPVQISIPRGSEGTITIYDTNGRKLTQKNIDNSGGLVAMNLEGYPAGVYKLVFTDVNYKTNIISIIITHY